MSKQTIELKHPLTVSGAQVSVLHLRRPKVRDLERMERAGDKDVAKSITLIADLSEQDPDTIRDLDAEDFVAVSEAVGAMLGKKITPAA